MKLKRKWFEKKVDERQEMDLLKVEHFGFWLMYYMLLAGIRSCLLYSILTSIGIGTVFGLLFAFKWNNTSLKGIAVYIIMTVASLFVISCPAFLLAGALTKQREKRLAGQDFEEDDDEEEEI